jgi:hypothetical protein
MFETDAELAIAERKVVPKISGNVEKLKVLRLLEMMENAVRLEWLRQIVQDPKRSQEA